MMYKCMKCKEIKPQYAFSVDTTRPAKRKVQAFCKLCKKQLNKVYRVRTEVANRVYKSHIKKHYGMTIEELNTLKDSQNNKCLICEVESPRLQVDHCHKTGRIRGLLCRNCNVGIGVLKDNAELLRKAAAYLERRPHEQS